jgi:uncharacterized membrane protein
MSTALIVLIGSQIVFTITDLLGRHYMAKQGFHLASFMTGWFFVYAVLRTIATLGQLYVFTKFDLGRTAALFGAMAIVLSATMGFLILKEALSVQAYIGIMLAITAFIVLAVK